MLALENVPARVHFVCTTRAEALNVCRGSIRLAVCASCGHVFNHAFDPSLLDYRDAYENALHFSPRFERYLQGLVEGLVVRRGFRNARIIEIGCGDGHFLGALCRRGDNQGLGFDPSAGADKPPSAGGRIRWLSKPLESVEEAHPADLVCCRHVLEHVPEPRAFLNRVKAVAAGSGNTLLYIEVPNARDMMEQSRLWDVIYEHCGYYTAESLVAALGRAGWRVSECGEAFGGQYLCAFASPEGGAEQQTATATVGDELAHSFAAGVERLHDQWRERFDAWHAHGEKVVLWGAGSKSVSFVNLLGLGAEIAAVADINPRKHGKFVAGTGHEMVAPERLRKLRPDRVIIMNPVYREEVEGMLREMDIATVCVTA